MLVPFQNGGKITDFYFASFRFGPNFEEKKIPKDFFNEIWLKEGEHEYIYIPEINSLTVISFQNGGQNNFFDIAQ